MIVVIRADVHENGAGRIDSQNGYQPADPGLTGKLNYTQLLFKILKMNWLITSTENG
jgi:hypothetical protein